jgi:nitrate/TMAO reductase-like tetraheme cytochrome c subunit
MPRTLLDEYELPDDDDDLPYEGKLYRRRRRSPVGPFFVLLAFGALVAAVASLVYFSGQQESDQFCVSCHTPQHEAYLERAAVSMAGALAPDLASYHYQQIRGQGGDIRCINCHRGDGSTQRRLETMLLSARMAGAWLAGADDRRLEKTAITTTVVNGITQTVAQTALALHHPRLSNDGCIACHEQTLLAAGMDNHMHTMLPAVYLAWKNGARLIAPPNTSDPQAVIAQGLAPFNTTLECSSCHQTHRSLETELYLDRQGVVKPACEQCHREVGLGPATVTIAEPE